MSNLAKYDPSKVALAKRIATYVDTHERTDVVPAELLYEYLSLSKVEQEEVYHIVEEVMKEEKQLKQTINVVLQDRRPVLSDKGVDTLLAGIVGIIFAFCGISFFAWLNMSAHNYYEVPRYERTR